MRLVDLAGQRFGRLVVIERAENRGQKTRWRCRCDCGAESTPYAIHLRSGAAQSCGCQQRARARVDVAARNVARSSRGGLSKHPLYATWRGMLARCNNPALRSYKHYGARGIKVCPEWSDEDTGFRQFIADVGERPPNPPGWASRAPYYTLDREDVDGDYEPGNVRWSSTAIQMANRRPVIHLAEAAGRVRALTDSDSSFTPDQRAKLAALFEEVA